MIDFLINVIDIITYSLQNIFFLFYCQLFRGHFHIKERASMSAGSLDEGPSPTLVPSWNLSWKQGPSLPPPPSLEVGQDTGGGVSTNGACKHPPTQVTAR